MLWMPLALTAYFFLGFVAIIDKKLLTKRIPEPISYAFYVGILNIIALLLIPFGFRFLSYDLMLFALASGIAFVIGIYFLYSTLKQSEASRAVPLIGAATPIFILFFTTFLAKTYLTNAELSAIGLFIGGGILLSLQSNGNGKNGKGEFFRGHINHRVILLGLLAAFFFAVYLFLAKEVFKEAAFIPGFIWMRAGNVLTALFILLLPSARRLIFQTTEHITPSSSGIFAGNQILGATSSILLHIAIFLGPVAIINAMQGIQYFFIFVFALFFTAFFPRILKETFSAKVILSKFAGMLAVAGGFVFLFL